MRYFAMFFAAFILTVWLASPADAAPNPVPFPCPYPAVGVAVPDIAGVYAGFCDFPTEINCTHMHWESGGFQLADLLGGSSLSGGGLLLGFGGIGAGGGVSQWRYPDNTPGPPPNPPGAWKNYIVPLSCPPEHATPAGGWSDVAHGDQGVGPVDPGNNGARGHGFEQPDNTHPVPSPDQPDRAADGAGGGHLAPCTNPEQPNPECTQDQTKPHQQQ